MPSRAFLQVEFDDDHIVEKPEADPVQHREADHSSEYKAWPSRRNSAGSSERHAEDTGRGGDRRPPASRVLLPRMA